MMDMDNWSAFQISLSTAEEGEYYFTGEQHTIATPNFQNLFPSGKYRVMNGQLFRIVDGVPPQFSNASTESSFD